MISIIFTMMQKVYAILATISQYSPFFVMLHVATLATVSATVVTTNQITVQPFQAGKKFPIV